MKSARRLFNGPKLQELMDAKGMSTREVAEKVRANQGNVSRWIRGENQPRPRKIKALCALFRVNRETLLLPEGGENNGQGK